MLKTYAEYLQSSLSYPEYIQLSKNLLSENKTTGPDQSPAMIEYTRLNDKRVDRILSKGQLLPEVIEKISDAEIHQTWLCLSEPWCGDAAQNLPWIYKMSELNPGIQFRILLRDENPELMDAWLTNGGKAIPKILFLNPELEVVHTWGPRPVLAQEIMTNWKMNPVVSREEIYKELHTWYSMNAGKELQQEFLTLLNL